MAEQTPGDPLLDIYQQALDLIPRKVKRACDIRYEILIKLGNMLDRPDPEGNDWRVMASKLDFPNSMIDTIAYKETEKTVAVLRKAARVTSEKVVRAFYEMGRRDALELLVDFYSSRNCEDPNVGAVGGAPPVRAHSMDEVMESSERHPVQVRPDRAVSEPVDSGYAAGSLQLPRQESSEGRAGITGGPALNSSFSSSSSFSNSFGQLSQGSTDDHIEEDFFCEESRQFWYTVKGSSSEVKIYFHFVTALKAAFPNDPLAKNNRVLKLIKYVFGIKGDKRDEVKVGNFVLLLGWFGPFRADAQGRCVCLAQIQSLIEGSTTRVGNRLDSWFAGFMSQEEANSRLRGQKKSTFLVRFSESLRDDGGFSVALSVGEDQEPVHFNIKGNPTAAAGTVPFDACLEFVPDHDSAKTYPDLATLVNKRLRGGNPVYGDVFCVRPCPDLPLNVTFTGYEENGAR